MRKLQGSKGSTLRRIAVVLPAYNEETMIAQVVTSLRSALIENIGQHNFDIIVIDDGSTDSTAQILHELEGISVVSHIINSGAGAATRTGLHFAYTKGCDVAITMDSDGQHSPIDVVKMISEALKGDADLIIGSRLMGQGNMPWYKVMGNKSLGFITYMLLGVYASDTQSGLKSFSRAAIPKINFHSNNYAFCSEIIWKAHQAGLRIKEIPIEAIYTDYSLSRGQKNISGAFSIVSHLVKRRFMELMNG